MQKVVQELVSVIIPCYNASEFIEETLQSIVSQSYNSLEIIVIDDGSKDDSSKKIEKFSSVSYYYQENAGVSVARNNGLALAKGEYIVFFDADDLMTKDFLKDRIALLEADNLCGFSCGLINCFSETNTSLKKLKGAANNPQKELLTFNQEYAAIPSNYLFRKKYLLDYEVRFNSKLQSAADKFFILELSSKVKGVFSNDIALLDYRIVNNSMSHKLTPKLILDKKVFYQELKSKKLIPDEFKREFEFKIKYIIGASYVKLNKWLNSVPWFLTLVVKYPFQLIKRVF